MSVGNIHSQVRKDVPVYTGSREPSLLSHWANRTVPFTQMEALLHLLCVAMQTNSLDYFHRSRDQFWVSPCHGELGSKGSIDREHRSIGVMPDYSQVAVDGRSISPVCEWGATAMGWHAGKGHTLSV